MAPQLPVGFFPDSILNIGCGTGETLMAVAKAITPNRDLRRLMWVDAVSMVQVTGAKLEQCM